MQSVVRALRILWRIIFPCRMTHNWQLISALRRSVRYDDSISENILNIIAYYREYGYSRIVKINFIDRRTRHVNNRRNDLRDVRTIHVVPRKLAAMFFCPSKNIANPTRVMGERKRRKRECRSFAAASRFRAHYFLVLIAPSPAFRFGWVTPKRACRTRTASWRFPE